MKKNGKKFDGDKPRWDLLPLDSVREIVRVLTYGSNKYSDNNWQSLDKPIDRYYAALMRHIVAWRTGEDVDPETGIQHLAHAGCCILFLLWFTLRERRHS